MPSYTHGFVFQWHNSYDIMLHTPSAAHMHLVCMEAYSFVHRWKFGTCVLTLTQEWMLAWDSIIVN